MHNMTKSGATELALRISNYWVARGFPNVEITVVHLGLVEGDGHHLFGIRSNLVNGHPPERMLRAA